VVSKIKLPQAIYNPSQL